MKNKKDSCPVPPNLKKTVRGLLLLFALSGLPLFACAQSIDSTKTISYLSGAVHVTNNGLSVIPTFSLGKPAAIFDLSIGKRKLSFEPQLRFSLEGKPWSFLFWWRYKLLKTKKIALNAGAHPALLFRTETLQASGISKELIVSRRFLAAEVAPNYLIAKDISVGIYYLYSRGLDKGATKHTHFLTINGNFSHIKLYRQFYLRFIPQVYYLKLDKQDGFYCTSTLTLARPNSPFAVSSILNKAIQSNISGSKDFAWNVSLIYSFQKKHLEI